MGIWIISGIALILVTIIYFIVMLFDNIKMRKQRKNSELCEDIGHEWNGNECKRCGYKKRS